MASIFREIGVLDFHGVGGVWTLDYYGVLSFSAQHSCREINAFAFCPWNCRTSRAEAIGCTISAGNRNRWHRGEHAGRMPCLVTAHLTEWDTRRNEELKSRKVSTGWMITCTLCINYPIFFSFWESQWDWWYHLPFQVKCWGYTVSQGKCQVVPKPGCWSPWPWHGMITGLQSGVIRSKVSVQIQTANPHRHMSENKGFSVINSLQNQLLNRFQTTWTPMGHCLTAPSRNMENFIICFLYCWNSRFG